MNFGATTENAPSQRYNKSVAVVVTITTDNRATWQIAMLNVAFAQRHGPSNGGRRADVSHSNARRKLCLHKCNTEND
jgi:hypothetical protein